MPLCRAKAAPISSSEDFSKGGRGMQSENRMFDDFVKVLNGAAGTFAGMGREAEANFRERVREWVGGMDMVRRDEFEAVKAIAVAAREELGRASCTDRVWQ